MGYYYFDFCDVILQPIQQNDSNPEAENYKIIEKGGYTSVIQNQHTKGKKKQMVWKSPTPSTHAYAH